MGLACGAGLFIAAVIATSGILIIQTPLRFVEYRFFPHNQPLIVTVRVQHATGVIASIEHVLATAPVPLRGLRIRCARDGEEDRINLLVGAVSSTAVLRLLDQLHTVDGVRDVTYQGRLPRSSATVDRA